MSSLLSQKISQKTAKVAVIGLGYVGLSIAFETAKQGFITSGIEICEEKIREINAGKSHISDISDEDLKPLVEQEKLRATQDYSVLKYADIIFICVPIPLDAKDNPVLTHLIQAVQEIRNHLHKDQLIILESTTFPGTTEEIILPILEETGLKVEKDFCLAYSPERIDPGNQEYRLKNTPKLIGGITPRCSEISQAFYKHFVDHTIVVSSPRVAEMAKLHENTFRAINIAFVNEMAMNCDRLGIDIWEVIDAANSKPFGFMPFYPGPGIGGHCIPVVPHYIRWKLKTVNRSEHFIKLADQINDAMPHFVVKKTAQALGLIKQTISKAKILILGVAFKADVNDSSYSPALPVMEILHENGADLSYSDPFVSQFAVKNHVFKSIDWEKNIQDFDCCILITNHSHFNISEMVKRSKVFVDTRNATKDIKGYEQKIVKI